MGALNTLYGDITTFVNRRKFQMERRRIGGLDIFHENYSKFIKSILLSFSLLLFKLIFFFSISFLLLSRYFQTCLRLLHSHGKCTNPYHYISFVLAVLSVEYVLFFILYCCNYALNSLLNAGIFLH